MAIFLGYHHRLINRKDWFSRRAVLLGLASLAGEISRAPAQVRRGSARYVEAFSH